MGSQARRERVIPENIQGGHARPTWGGVRETLARATPDNVPSDDAMDEGDR